MSLPLALLLVALVAGATLLGGLLPLRLERFNRAFLFFSAGSLVSLALLELIPEAIDHIGGEAHGSMLWVVGAFLVTMLADKLHVLHPHEHGMSGCPEKEHAHAPLAMHGAVGLLVHSAIDGVALVTALRESIGAGVTVAIALSAHKIADGLTTVSLVLSHHHNRRQALAMLIGNAGMLLAGCAVGGLLPLRETHLAALLLIMAGFFLYLGATDLIPSLSTSRCRKRDVLATALGMAAIAVVSMLAH